MGILLTLKMVKQLRIKGFTMLESLLVLFMLAVCTSLSLPLYQKVEKCTQVNEIMEEIAIKQYETILESDYDRYINDKENVDILFNRIGSVMHAATIHLSMSDVIVTLGTGRIYVKD